MENQRNQIWLNKPVDSIGMTPIFCCDPDDLISTACITFVCGIN